MRKDSLVASVVGALILAASIGWLSWWRGEIGQVKFKMGLSWVEVCTPGGCVEADFDRLEQMSAKKSSDVPWRIRITRWVGWATVLALLAAGLIGGRELAGLYVSLAVVAIAFGAWSVFGNPFDLESSYLKTSWGWPAFIVGSVIGLAGARSRR